jgi:hypothetical protein
MLPGVTVETPVNSQPKGENVQAMGDMGQKWASIA